MGKEKKLLLPIIVVIVSLIILKKYKMHWSRKRNGLLINIKLMKCLLKNKKLIKIFVEK